MNLIEQREEYISARQEHNVDLSQSSSEYSIRKNRKIHKKTTAKKNTKIVHTFCIRRKAPNGKKKWTYIQKYSETAVKDHETL